MKNILAVIVLLMSFGVAHAQQKTIDINSLPIPTTGSGYLTNSGTVNGDWIPVNRNGITYKVLAGQGGNCSANNFVSSINPQGVPSCGIPSIGALTVMATGTTTSLTLANQTSLTVDAQQFGALQDGTTDDTASINTALLAVSTAVGHNGQVGFVRLHGNSIVCGLTMYRNAILDFQGGSLKVKNGCAVAYPISSENYVANKASNQGNTCGSSSLVPAWFGFRNAKIDCNTSAASYSNECIGFYGPSQIMAGITMIENGKNSPALNTIDANGGTATPQCQEEGHIDTLIIKNSSGQGWWTSTHDGDVGTFIGGFNADYSFVGGGIDHIGLMHTYAETNGKGMKFTGDIFADAVMSDGDLITIPSTNFGPVIINKLFQYNCGYTGSVTPCLDQQGSVVTINQATCDLFATATNTTCIKWGTTSTANANNTTLNGFTTAPNTGGANSGNKGIDNYSSGSIFSNLQTGGFSGTGGTALDEHGTNNIINGEMDDDKIGLAIEGGGAGEGDIINMNMFQISGQSAYTGTIPGTMNFNLACSGGGTNCKIFDNIPGGSASTVALSLGGDTKTGIYSVTTSVAGIAAAGVPMVAIGSTSMALGDIGTSQDGFALIMNSVGTGNSIIQGYGPSGDANVELLLAGKGTGGVGLVGGNNLNLQYKLGTLSVLGSAHTALLDIGFNGSNDYTAWYTPGGGAADAAPTMVMSGGGVGIGIGTAQPVSRLVVSGGVSIGSDYNVGGIGTNGLSVEGNVSIGTTTPTQPLTVVGNGTFSSAVTIGTNAFVSGASLTTAGAFAAPYAPIIVGNNGGVAFTYNNAMQMAFASGNDVLELGPFGTGAGDVTPVLYLSGSTFDGNGSVGIGSSGPRAALDLSQKTGAVILPIGTTGQRPTPLNGMIRYNSGLTPPAIEAYQNNVWNTLPAAAGFTSVTTVVSTGATPQTATCASGYYLTGPGCSAATIVATQETYVAGLAGSVTCTATAGNVTATAFCAH